jgi:hypothetical protein
MTLLILQPDRNDGTPRIADGTTDFFKKIGINTEVSRQSHFFKQLIKK